MQKFSSARVNGKKRTLQMWPANLTLPTFPECNARGNCTARALIQSCSKAYRGSPVPCIQDCRYGYAGRKKEANPEAHLGRGPLGLFGLRRRAPSMILCATPTASD